MASSAGGSGANSLTALSYEALLPLVPELLEHPERHRGLYGEEEEGLIASHALFDSGRAVIRDLAEVDLAVVTLEGPPPVSGFPIGHRASIALHPMALHSATSRPRVLVISGGRFTYHDRYETWVTYRSRRLALRRDLAPLAAMLSEQERGGAVWRADPPGALVAALDHDQESTLGPERVIDALREHLLNAPVAWDPFVGATRRRSRLSGPGASRSGTSGPGRSR
jgi:hypothetical protein